MRGGGAAYVHCTRQGGSMLGRIRKTKVFAQNVTNLEYTSPLDGCSQRLLFNDTVDYSGYVYS
eukprot:533436-Prymnesium_polylepis.1